MTTGGPESLAHHALQSLRLGEGDDAKSDPTYQEGHDAATELGKACRSGDADAILAAFKALMACCGDQAPEPEIAGDDNYMD